MTDWGWVSRQMATSSAKVNALVTNLLHTLDQVDHGDVSDDERREVLDKFHKLALGHALIEADPDEEWEPVIPGEYRIGDTVRVKDDAYSGTKGRLHNGRRGRVTVAHGPSCSIMYDGEQNTEVQYNHRLETLERLVR